MVIFFLHLHLFHFKSALYGISCRFSRVNRRSVLPRFVIAASYIFPSASTFFISISITLRFSKLRALPAGKGNVSCLSRSIFISAKLPDAIFCHNRASGLPCRIGHPGGFIRLKTTPRKKAAQELSCAVRHSQLFTPWCTGVVSSVMGRNTYPCSLAARIISSSASAVVCFALVSCISTTFSRPGRRLSTTLW